MLVKDNSYRNKTNGDNKIVNRENLLSINNKSLANYYEKLYMSILKESWFN